MGMTVCAVKGKRPDSAIGSVVGGCVERMCEWVGLDPTRGTTLQREPKAASATSRPPP